MSACHCQSLPNREETFARESRRTPVRLAAASTLSILVAFFPKCPICWAAYTSSLGIAGISSLPYPQAWFPVLVAMLGLHLWLLFRQTARVGYGPFTCSVFGISTLLLARQYAPQTHWLLSGGILFTVGGSVWNSISMSLRKADRLPATDRPNAVEPAPNHACH